MFASWLYCKYFGHQRQAIHLRKRACIWWPDITTEAFNIFILKATAIYEIKPIKRYSWSMPKHFRPSGCHFRHRSYHTPPAFSITSLSRTNCVDFGQIQSISYKNCGGISPPPPPTSHKPRHVPITPKMVHMVTNKHNFKSHSKVDRPLAMKTTCGEQS